MSKQDLQSFLQTLTEGKSVTPGEFKVDTSELLRKFASVLPDAEGWLLKVLQALCHWGAETLKVGVQRKTLSLRATGVSPTHPLTCATVFEHKKEWRGHYHLFAAVLSLINDSQYERFQLQWYQGEANHRLVFEGSRLVQAADTWREERGGRPGEFVLSLTKKTSSKKAFKLFWKANFGDLSGFLASRAKCFPIPIQLDGMVLEFPSKVGVAEALDTGRGLILEEGAGREEREAGLLGLQVFHDAGGRGPVANVRPGYYLAWVQDGVVAHFQLERTRLDRLNVITYLDGRGLPNDLTTLQVRESEERRERLDKVAQHLSWRARHLDSLRWRVTNAMPPDPGKFRGPVRENDLLPAVLQSVQHEKYREEHQLKSKLYRAFKDVEKEAIWLAAKGGEFLTEAALGLGADFSA